MPKGGPYYVKKPGVRCRRCGAGMQIGEQYTWDRERGGIIHPACKGSTNGETATAPVTTAPVATANGEVHSTNGNGEASIGKRLAEEIIPYLPSWTVDEEKVREIVQAAVDAKIAAPTVVNMPGAFTVTLPDVRHEMTEKLLYLIGKKKNVYLKGPSGAGKTTVCEMLANSLGIPYGEISLDPMTPRAQLFGFMRPDGTYQDTVFYNVWKDGGLFAIDEIDNGGASTLTTLNSAFQNGHCAFPCGMVPRHPNCAIVATGNTAGRGPTKEFPDRRALDPATRKRFTMLDWNYDEKLETALVTAINPKDADSILRWVREIRRQATAKGVQVQATPVSAMLLAEYYLDGVLTHEEAADATVWQGLPDAQRDALGVGRCPEGGQGA